MSYCPRVDACVIVPAFDAATTLAAVLADLADELPNAMRLVVDDGSTDDTSAIAERGNARVLRHGKNRGKGAALATGLEEAERLGFGVAITVDADGQHPAAAAAEVLRASKDPRALV